MTAALCESQKCLLHDLPSLAAAPTCHGSSDCAEQYWYFAYGSNLNDEVFLGRRGIQPLDQRRVLVPGWRLDFQIAGIPYAEPGFGSIDQVPEEDAAVQASDNRPELQGIAYLVTRQDYRRIIATEGGDSSYRQLKLRTIDALTKDELYVWTLQAIHPRKSCQPSLRYMTLIREGAQKHDFPQAYLDYLNAIEPFVLKGKRQKLGAAIFVGFWMPIFMWIFAAKAQLTRADGTSPRWLATFTSIVFKSVWEIHDTYWAGTFGRGDHNLNFEDRIAVDV